MLSHITKTAHKVARTAARTRTKWKLKRSNKARIADTWLRSKILQLNQFYVDRSDLQLIHEAIRETEDMKDYSERLTELLVLHSMIIRDTEEIGIQEENIALSVQRLKKYHALILLEAYIELMTKPRAKRLYRFKGSKYVFKKSFSERRNSWERGQSIEISV